MIRKPNPLQNFWIGCKIVTAVFTQFYGMIMIIGGVIFLSQPLLSIIMFAMGAACYMLGKSITKSLIEEETRDNEGSDDETGTV
jgi:hypothetical protein